MQEIDDITSLPLTPSLLKFYRDKVRDNVRQSARAFDDSLDRLLPELDHMHRLEASLSSSFTTIKSFESENHDLRALLSQVIEENVRLRLKQNPDCADSSLSARLLDSLASRPAAADHSSVISSLVERCEALEAFATQTLSDLKNEKVRSEELSVQAMELQESLQHNTKQWTSELQILKGQPSLQDWEFLRAEVASLTAQQARDQADLRALGKENEKLRGRISSLANCSERQDHPPCASVVCAEDDMEQDMTRLKDKLDSLERFATKFMPDDRVVGVPEFFHTVDKTKGRLNDVEQRLARRMRGRR
ncbi:protein of unknown function [Taphrina deformans PYCC 5710]|uniref:Uncharacterized protein n=1 Tax=Taphrina deformans (strain PYCC 5710 / ATCC 11124 / CBS 356.35 / IMI 108563 / JCM 9778 / NBRC 8474) TaxID=1097556 RepID=R4X912_TAPDE|nr:protein of unknown function [Taphrina deformans PYCC 5710]|eukprot:CCG80642.1 protein of unknown function [Taphrina deformans PYCC 5710]